MEAWKHVRAILLLPFVVTVVIPGVLLYVRGTNPFDLYPRVPAGGFVVPAIGVAVILCGITMLITTIRLFVRIGKGTLAPWDPTRKLVVQGIYRHVRNPMISGVFCVLTGEAMAAASLALLGWAMLFIAVNSVYMPFVEEPGLLKRFGNEYEEYRRNVPRWIPQANGWDSIPPAGPSGLHEP